jgi:transposase
MLALPGNAKIFLYEKSIDMRKGFEGLGAVIAQSTFSDITSGAYFAFLNKKKDRMKVLFWDGDGQVIWYKRLEKGRFSGQKTSQPLMNRRDFFLLLEGIEPKRLQTRYKIP